MAKQPSRFLIRVAVLAAWPLALHAAATGQETGEAAEAPPALPPVERVELTTADGVLLTGSYFRPTASGRQTPVVVLLPDQGESHEVFDRLAARLRGPTEEGERTPMAALSVSLRGQGGSTKQRLPDGTERDLRGARLTPQALAAMVHQDLEAVRRFLVARNDAGELNLNRLAYFGVGMGGVVATNGAALDWSVQDLNTGKQGKDVKALLLVSAPWTFRGLGMLEALRQPGVQSQVAVMAMYGGQQQQAVENADRILRQLTRARGEAPPPAEGELPSVFDVPAATALQGSAWLKQGGAQAEDLILRFLEQHLAAPDHRWTQRRLD